MYVDYSEAIKEILKVKRWKNIDLAQRFDITKETVSYLANNTRPISNNIKNKIDELIASDKQLNNIKITDAGCGIVNNENHISKSENEEQKKYSEKDIKIAQLEVINKSLREQLDKCEKERMRLLELRTAPIERHHEEQLIGELAPGNRSDYLKDKSQEPSGAPQNKKKSV